MEKENKTWIKHSQKIECRAEWRAAPSSLKEWASPTLDSHAQPSCFYCHLLKLAAHPFTHMSEPAASRKVTGTFVNINNYSVCIPKLLTSALQSPLSVRAEGSAGEKSSNYPAQLCAILQRNNVILREIVLCWKSSSHAPLWGGPPAHECCLP